MPDRLSQRREYVRYEIITLFKNNIQKKVIANYVNVHIRTIYRCIHRFEGTRSFTDYHRSGRPVIYDQSIQQKLVAFYCQTTPLPGIGHWTVRWAERYLACHSEILGASVSRSTISRTLNAQHLKPHRSKYFLQITDPDFFPKMEHLLQLYLNPPKNLFCYDECTGIQVLSRIAPDVRPGLFNEDRQVWLREFEYIRNGTMDLLAFFNVNTGKVNVCCKGDHKKSTFISVFEEHVKILPKNERIDYVMDNLASHYSYDFCKVVAELSNVPCPSEKQLKTGEHRRNWLQSSDKRVAIHFTPFHGSWLNMVEIWFCILSSKCLKEAYSSPDELVNTIYAFSDIWSSFLAHSFQWSYDGSGLHKKVVHRFIRFLENSSDKIHITFLSKQLLLMINLINQYREEVPVPEWLRLLALLLNNKDILLACIEKDDKPKRKDKAKVAFDKLLLLLSYCFYPEYDLVA